MALPVDGITNQTALIGSIMIQATINMTEKIRKAAETITETKGRVAGTTLLRLQEFRERKANPSLWKIEGTLETLARVRTIQLPSHLTQLLPKIQEMNLALAKTATIKIRKIEEVIEIDQIGLIEIERGTEMIPIPVGTGEVMLILNLNPDLVIAPDRPVVPGMIGAQALIPPVARVRVEARALSRKILTMREAIWK